MQLLMLPILLVKLVLGDSLGVTDFADATANVADSFGDSGFCIFVYLPKACFLDLGFKNFNIFTLSFFNNFSFKSLFAITLFE